MKIKTLLWCGFASVCVVMVVLVGIGFVQLNAIDKHVSNIVRAGRNESLARDIAEHVNSMRRYQLSALAVAAEERDKELARVAKTGVENARLAEELEKNQRHPETRELAASMRTLNDRYASNNEQVVALAREGKLDAMRDLIHAIVQSEIFHSK